MKEQTKNKKLRGLVWITSIVSLAAVVIAISASWLLYKYTVVLITENLHERLLTISITQAANIDANDLEALQVKDDWMKPEWAHVVNKMHKTKYSNKDIVFMYIFRKTKSDPQQMEFVADADSIDPFANSGDDPSIYVDVNRDGNIEPDGPDKLQWPGQPYPEAVEIPETFEAYNEALTVKDLYTDAYGTVLTGYAPIKDDNGNTVAILGADIKADDFFTVTRQTLFPFLTFIAFLISIILALSIILIYIWTKQAKALSDTNKRLDGLIHFISHEIKGHMTKNEAAFAGILDGDYGAVTNETKTLAEGALADTRRGVTTVMDILSASNLKKGTVEYKMSPFDLKQTTLRTLVGLEDTAKAKGLSLETSFGGGPFMVNGDQNEIGDHVIKNLVDNAIKYTPRGKIEVSLRKQNAKILFSVRDSGIGITEEDKKNLFTEGGRGKEAVRTNVSSTGYGLYIAKQIVDAHKGRIWAESEGAGKGSTFFVELPI